MSSKEEFPGRKPGGGDSKKQAGAASTSQPSLVTAMSKLSLPSTALLSESAPRFSVDASCADVAVEATIESLFTELLNFGCSSDQFKKCAQKLRSIANKYPPYSELINQRIWEIASLSLPRTAIATTQKGSDPNLEYTRCAPVTVFTNFFRISFAPDKQRKELYKYSIKLGSIESSRAEEDTERQTYTPRNRQTKRNLIDSLLNSGTPKPTAQRWASDYNAFVISSEELYLGSSQSLWDDTDVTHNRTGPRNEMLTMTSTVRYLGKISWSDMQHLVSAPRVFKKGDVPYFPEEDLGALNIIMGQAVNDPTWQQQGGGVLGKRFYPQTGDLKDPEDGSTTPTKLCRIRNGFYGSARPAIDNVLRNLNTVTTVFYAPINLQTWIELKWPNWRTRRIPDREFNDELKGVRVRFQAKDEDPRRGKPIQDVRGPMQRQFFIDKGREVLVRDYLEDSEYISCPA